MMLMDHFKSVTGQSPHNGLSVSRLAQIFGPLLFCTTTPHCAMPPDVAASAAAAGLPLVQHAKQNINFVDARLAASILAFIVDLWPARVSECRTM